jgi:hypothetical protein
VSTEIRWYSPIISFLVLSHIRLQPIDQRDGGRTGNAPSGTLVNHDIVSPDKDQPEFYLLSQGGLLGTSVPARYTVLLDEQVKRDEQGKKLRDARGRLLKIPLGAQSTLYSLSYLLCHTQQRATRVVSLPTPVYCEWLVPQSVQGAYYPRRCPCKCQGVVLASWACLTLNSSSLQEAIFTSNVRMTNSLKTLTAIWCLRLWIGTVILPGSNLYTRL